MAEEKKTEGTVGDAVIDASKLAAAAAAAASWEGIKKAGVDIDAFNSALMKSNSTLALNEEAARKVNDRLLQLSIANKDVGMTSKEANEIYKELSKTLASRVRKGFDDTAGALLQQTKLWSNLGVETGNTTKFINLFDTALGSSSNEIIKTGQYNLFKMHGISAASDFEAGNDIDLLIRYKDETIPHFTNINTRHADSDTPYALAVFEDALPATPKLTVAPEKLPIVERRSCPVI